MKHGEAVRNGLDIFLKKIRINVWGFAICWRLPKKGFRKDYSPGGNLGYGNRCWLSAHGGSRERGREGRERPEVRDPHPSVSLQLPTLLNRSLFCDALFSSSSSSFPSAINLRIFRQRQSPSPSSSSSSSSLLPAFLLCMYNNNMGLGGGERRGGIWCLL